MTLKPFVLAGLVAASCAALAAPFAYVPNEGSGTLSIIDTSTDTVVAELPAGKKPRGTVISLDGRTAYVSDQPGNRLVMLDLAARKPAGAIALGESPEGVGISADGRWVAAAWNTTSAPRSICERVSSAPRTGSFQAEGVDPVMFCSTVIFGLTARAPWT